MSIDIPGRSVNEDNQPMSYAACDALSRQIITILLTISEWTTGLATSLSAGSNAKCTRFASLFNVGNLFETFPMSSVASKQALLIIFTGATIAGLFVWYIRGKREDERKKKRSFSINGDIKAEGPTISSTTENNTLAAAKKTKRSKRSSDSVNEPLVLNEVDQSDNLNINSSSNITPPVDLEIQNDQANDKEEEFVKVTDVGVESEKSEKSETETKTENENLEEKNENIVVESQKEEPVLEKSDPEKVLEPETETVKEVRTNEEELKKKVKVHPLKATAAEVMLPKKKSLESEQIPEEPTPTKLLGTPLLSTPLSLDISAQMSPGSFSWCEEMENHNEEDFPVNESSDMESSPVSPSHKGYRSNNKNNRNRRGRGSGSQSANKKSQRRLNLNEQEEPEKQRIVNGVNATNEPKQLESHHEPVVTNEDVEYEKIDSPGLVSQNSEASSQDSGRATGGLASSLSPMDENGLVGQLGEDDLLLPMYEFEIPNSLVGLVIGVKGKTIKELSTRTNVRMLIRQHHAPEKVKTHQICQVRGKRDEINHCLQMLRRRFPSPRFPELNLQPVLPPPLPNNSFDMLSTQPTWLTLPDDIKSEVAVSAIIDPSHFFIQQPTHASFASLRYLDMYMLRLYGENTNLPELPIPCQNGLLCAAPVANAWFRAVTVQYYEETDEVFVKFVDYGGYSKMARQDLRQIRTDLMSLPFQSTEVMLANVRPVDGTTNWKAAAMDEFTKLCTGKVINCKLVGYATDTRIPMVELFVPMKDSNGEQYEIQYDQVLMEKGLARTADPSKMVRSSSGAPAQVGGKRPSLASQTSQTTVVC